MSTWGSREIDRTLGIDPPKLRRYSVMLGYPEQPGSGKALRYLHVDVEAMWTVHLVQRAAAPSGSGGLHAPVIAKLLSELVDHEVVTLSLGPATLTVARQELEPPT